MMGSNIAHGCTLENPTTRSSANPQGLRSQEVKGQAELGSDREVEKPTDPRPAEPPEKIFNLK